MRGLGLPQHAVTLGLQVLHAEPDEVGGPGRPLAELEGDVGRDVVRFVEVGGPVFRSSQAA